MGKISETETVIKRIVPYLQRRGYDLDVDMTFEEPAPSEGRTGFVDILVNCALKRPLFVIEAKRDGTAITARHRTQALKYAKTLKCLFTAVTNGREFQLLNASTGESLRLNGSSLNRIPTKTDLTRVIAQLKKDPTTSDIILSTDKSLPFRPGLPLTKLNHLIRQCHNIIRKIEKNEEHAFADFSKILFLKLLEEKWDFEGTVPLYSYRFHELATTPAHSADQVQSAIKAMLLQIQTSTAYGNVLADSIRLKKDATYLKIVKLLSTVSFADCELDTKGAAFEYFVRATLKGKKLGQYFTPRPLVHLMLDLGRYEQILSSLAANQPFKVLDPACGTGGFLVHAMNLCLEQVKEKAARGDYHPDLEKKLTQALRSEVFFGIDAHDGVASSAKMNMIVAGDGHNNIQCEDSLALEKLIPDYTHKDTGAIISDGKAHLLLTNPPFGTTEGDSLPPSAMSRYEVPSTRGQALFLQRMVQSVTKGSRIVTVIDDGVLNTESYKAIRNYVLRNCEIEWVVSLPPETFKPNKINVKASVLVLRLRDEPDEDLASDYPIKLVELASLGYDGSGEEVRGFDLDRLRSEVCKIDASTLSDTGILQGYEFSAFKVKASTVVADGSRRLDIKYWRPEVRVRTEKLAAQANAKQIRDLNAISTKRGKSPPASEYVAEHEGYALVVKAGSSITKMGCVLPSGDFIEKAIFDAYATKYQVLQDGDIVLASTGDGTLGKCGVFRPHEKDGQTVPAVPDGHVTVIRVDTSQVVPEFLCDYLRSGFGKDQVDRLYTGSTGLIEITPSDVDRIVVPKLPDLATQKELSESLRGAETKRESLVTSALEAFDKERLLFYATSLAPG